MSTARTWIEGVSQPLPAGEELRWEGRPSWRAVARHALHVRLLALYFGLILLIGLMGALGGRNGPQAQGVAMIAGVVIMQLVLATVVLGLVCAYAMVIARGTVYAITDRRVVMKVGVVLPTTINIPFRLVEAADLRRFPDGTGQVSLRLARSDRIGYLHLWPHARPWRLRYPEPMLIGLGEPDEVAKVLLAAVAEHEDGTTARRPDGTMAEQDGGTAGRQEGAVVRRPDGTTALVGA